MSRERDVWLQRIKSVEREHSATRLAIDRLWDDVQRTPSSFQSQLTLRDIRHASDQLDGTYTIRLFAEFEVGLRQFWMTARAKDPPSRTRDLVDGLGAQRRIPTDRIIAVHVVREYRNALVHEREDAVPALTIAEARSHLCRFFAFLPPHW